MFIEDDSPESIFEAVEKFNSSDYNPQEIRAHAEQFGVTRFKEEIYDFINQEYQKFKSV
jgi:UDP-N-acetylglucosamine:LPS N-acetylglucosamine transferase